MNSNKTNNKFNKLNEALKLKSQEEKLHFDTSIIHLDLMHQIQKLLDRNKMSHSNLANHLDVSEAFISKLFSADKFLNLEKIALIQKLFNVRFKFSFQNLVKASSSQRKVNHSVKRKSSGFSPSTSYNFPMVAKSKMV